MVEVFDKFCLGTLESLGSEQVTIHCDNPLEWPEKFSKN